MLSRGDRVRTSKTAKHNHQVGAVCQGTMTRLWQGRGVRGEREGIRSAGDCDQAATRALASGHHTLTRAVELQASGSGAGPS